MNRSAAVLLFLALPLSAAEPAFVSNLVKYKDSSLPHATGRAGNASIDAVALLGKDRVTDLTVTSNGSIDKVQVKLPGDDGAGNFNGISGASFSTRLQGTLRHDQLALQANVSGVDGARTDVVGATEVVKLRPDLAVALHAPARVRAGAPVDLSASVRELNGDVGARANCVLSVDGAETDRANNIWVDAGGDVLCRFNAALGAAGTHSVRVAVTGVAPGDWDDANNAAEASVTVYEAQPFDWYDTWMQEFQSHSAYSYESPWTTYSGTSDAFSQNEEFWASASMWLDPDTMTASVTETTGGALVDDTSDMTLTRRRGRFPDGSEFGCVSGFAHGRSVSGCVFKWSWGLTQLQFSTNRTSSDITYVSRGWDANYRDENGDVYTWNTESHTTRGVPHSWGSEVTLDVTFGDAATTFAAHAVTPLEPFSYEAGHPRTCYGDWLGRTVCDEQLFRESGKTGNVSGTHSF